ncbi:SAM-dependent methyltransferase [Streptomyces yunnanensis]|nr:methyltransferase domain-containing protein [Streptomyces yunnanensis]
MTANEASLRELEPGVVTSYYNDLTAKLLDKYGPGPDIHYHLGLYEDGKAPVHSAEASPEEIRASIVQGQRRHLDRAAQIWNAKERFTGSVLDVGCGLGGGSIFWARTFGADVTAVTFAEAHPPLISEFARVAGCEEKVRIVVSDACEIPADEVFDTVVAIESTCCFPLEPWFRNLARLLKPGGSVCVEDVMPLRPHGAPVWSDYYYTRPHTLQEYADAAHAAGFELVDDVDITAQAAPFWQESIAWTRAKLSPRWGADLDIVERRRLRISLAVHHDLLREWQSGGMWQAFLRFERRG